MTYIEDEGKVIYQAKDGSWSEVGKTNELSS